MIGKSFFLTCNKDVSALVGVSVGIRDFWPTVRAPLVSNVVCRRLSVRL